MQTRSKRVYRMPIGVDGGIEIPVPGESSAQRSREPAKPRGEPRQQQEQQRREREPRPPPPQSGANDRQPQHAADRSRPNPAHRSGGFEAQHSGPANPPARSTASVETTRRSDGPTAASKMRSELKPGTRVAVVQKEDQPTGQLTDGTIERLLTNSAHHPRGCKVLLTSGVVGRVQQILGGAAGSAGDGASGEAR